MQKPEYGGAGLPYTLGKVIEELLCSANVAFALYPGLTQGCFEAIAANGTDEQKNTYLPKLATGEGSGTKCMTEPQEGRSEERRVGNEYGSRCRSRWSR